MLHGLRAEDRQVRSSSRTAARIAGNTSAAASRVSTSTAPLLLSIGEEYEIRHFVVHVV